MDAKSLKIMKISKTRSKIEKSSKKTETKFQSTIRNASKRDQNVKKH
tara:strand:+ start:239 stop:379 length:141 start_codon:yes stop_codon:yes gene_type:complete